MSCLPPLSFQNLVTVVCECEASGPSEIFGLDVHSVDLQFNTRVSNLPDVAQIELVVEPISSGVLHLHQQVA
jgi:hypothetical protein